MPSTQIQLGLTLKSMTGSKKLITLMNRMGHSISYNTADELETELTFTATKNKNLLPADLLAKSYLRTGVAFDNYNRFVETVDGKNTLHDTVGIVYQDCQDETINSARKTNDQEQTNDETEH